MKDINSFIKEKECENLIKNYLDLKHEIFLKEKEESKKLRLEESKKGLIMDLNISNITTNKFERNIHKIRTKNIIKGKKGIVSISQNLHKNKMNSVLEKIWLKFNDEFDKEKDFNKFSSIIDIISAAGDEV